MKFKTKYVTTDPPAGSIRLKRVFAWLPKRLNGDVVWMEHFEIRQAFVIFDYNFFVDDKPKVASVGQWVNLEQRVIK